MVKKMLMNIYDLSEIEAEGLINEVKEDLYNERLSVEDGYDFDDWNDWLLIDSDYIKEMIG